MARATKLAWAAGLLDGEGCISVLRNNGKNGKYIGMHVIVRMADYAAVHLIHKVARCGTIRRLKPFTAKRRALWQWRCSSQEAARFLLRLLPFLVTKRTQAKWFLKLALRMKQRGYGPLSKKEREFQDEVVRMIRYEKTLR